MCFRTLRFRGVCALLLAGLQAEPMAVAQDAALREQAAALEAKANGAAQIDFLDFFRMRGLGSHAKVYDSRFNIWGNVRIASSLQLIDSAVSNFVAKFATKAGELKVNELAQSGEFYQGDRARMMEPVGFGGANGAFRDPGASARVNRIPAKDSPSWPVFQRNLGQQLTAVSGVKQPESVGFVPPDRERFYRQDGAGLRISTFESNGRYAPSASYMVTFGGDQLITEGPCLATWTCWRWSQCWARTDRHRARGTRTGSAWV